MSTPSHKKCSKCGKGKPIEDFHKNPTGKHGRRERCKQCVSKQRREYRHRNREKINAKKRETYYENRVEILANQRAYRSENLERIRKKNREYHWNNRDVILVKKRKYREDHLDERRAADREWREKNLSAVKKAQREYYRQNKAVYCDTQHMYQREMRELSKAFAANSGRRWSAEEDDILMNDRGLTMYEKAVCLKRSLSACAGRKTKLRKELNHAA